MWVLTAKNENASESTDVARSSSVNLGTRLSFETSVDVTKVSFS